MLHACDSVWGCILVCFICPIIVTALCCTVNKNQHFLYPFQLKTCLTFQRKQIPSFHNNAFIMKHIQEIINEKCLTCKFASAQLQRDKCHLFSCWTRSKSCCSSYFDAKLWKKKTYIKKLFREITLWCVTAILMDFGEANFSFMDFHYAPLGSGWVTFAAQWLKSSILFQYQTF